MTIIESYMAFEFWSELYLLHFNFLCVSQKK